MRLAILGLGLFMAMGTVWASQPSMSEESGDENAPPIEQIFLDTVLERTSLS